MSNVGGMLLECLVLLFNVPFLIVVDVDMGIVAADYKDFVVELNFRDLSC